MYQWVVVGSFLYHEAYKLLLTPPLTQLVQADPTY